MLVLPAPACPPRPPCPMPLAQHFVLYRDARASAPSAPLRSPLMLADEAALSASGVPPEKTPGLMEPE